MTVLTTPKDQSPDPVIGDDNSYSGQAHNIFDGFTIMMTVKMSVRGSEAERVPTSYPTSTTSYLCLAVALKSHGSSRESATTTTTAPSVAVPSSWPLLKPAYHTPSPLHQPLMSWTDQYSRGRGLSSKFDVS